MINVVLEFLRNVPKKISDKENDFDKIAVFKIFCNDNIVIFSAIENSFSKKKITVIQIFAQIYTIKLYVMLTPVNMKNLQLV